MRIGTIIKESYWYAVGTILSCGPSQVVGLIKGGIDLVGYAITEAKISSLQRQIQLGKPHLQSRLRETENARLDKIEQLKSDGLLLLPLIGTNLVWKTQRQPDFTSYIRAIFYPFSSETMRALVERRGFKVVDKQPASFAQVLKLEVYSEDGTRFLDTRYYQHFTGLARPTVVIFHANSQTCDSAEQWAYHYYNLGFDVLCPTMGGYPGSGHFHTCEKSTLEDVEAVRCFLQHKGVKSVGFHGISIGGSLAFQASTGLTKAQNLKTQFVIADQTFTTAEEVAANQVPKPLKSMTRGACRAAFPKGQRVNLGNGIAAYTDGLDNRRKAEELKKLNIPLFVITCENDSMMSDKGRNFGQDLLKARYDDPKEQEQHRFDIKGQWHSAFFGEGYFKTEQEALKAGHLPQNIKKLSDESFYVEVNTANVDSFVKNVWRH